MQVVKEVRTITGLGLKEAKDLVEGASCRPTPPPLHCCTKHCHPVAPHCLSSCRCFGLRCIIDHLLMNDAGAPKVVKGGLTKEEAAKFKDLLEKAGAKVSVS